MPVTKVGICNLALTRLGVKNIAALTDASEPARKVAQVYDNALDTVLQEHDWSFAASQPTVLIEALNITAVGWDYVYTLPTKCLFVRRVYNEATLDCKDEQDFKKVFVPSINSEVIYSNLAEAVCDYTYQVLDESIFSPSFVTALSLYLAHMVGPALVGSAYNGQAYQEYLHALDVARATNKSEGKETVNRPSDYEAAR